MCGTMNYDVDLDETGGWTKCCLCKADIGVQLYGEDGKLKPQFGASAKAEGAAVNRNAEFSGGSRHNYKGFLVNKYCYLCLHIIGCRSGRI